MGMRPVAVRQLVYVGPVCGFPPRVGARARGCPLAMYRRRPRAGHLRRCIREGRRRRDPIMPVRLSAGLAA